MVEASFNQVGGGVGSPNLQRTILSRASHLQHADFGEHAAEGGNNCGFDEHTIEGGNKRDFGEHATVGGNKKRNFGEHATIGGNKRELYPPLVSEYA